MAVAVAGFLVIVLVVLNRTVTRALEHLGRRYVQARLLPTLDQSGHELLRLDDQFVVAASVVRERPVEGPRSLRELDQALPGVEVLAVRRDQKLIGESPTDLTLDQGDALIVFGRRRQLVDLGLLEQQ